MPGVSDDGAEAGVRELRSVADVGTLKALADPVRLGILSALMERTDADLPVMSVKELAEALGEPQTKLYRHVKQLEAAGLIRVAATRLVSGIVEQRYQASQRDLMFGPGLLASPEATDETEPVVAALLDRYRQQFFAAHRAGQIPPGDYPAEQAHRQVLFTMAETRVSVEAAAAARARLQEVLNDLEAAEDRDGVPVNLLIGFYSPTDDGLADVHPAPDQD
jgi:DNA-binding transcriptional ArsR family regulator